MLFKTLNQDEEKSFREWAHENYKKGDPINEVWHPVVREECELMNSRWTDEDQIKCYGMTEAMMEAAFLREGNTNKYPSERTMYAMSILSDAQHIQTMDRKDVYGAYGVEPEEFVRQLINKAKYFISSVHKTLRLEGR